MRVRGGGMNPITDFRVYMGSLVLNDGVLRVKHSRLKRRIHRRRKQSEGFSGSREVQRMLEIRMAQVGVARWELEKLLKRTLKITSGADGKPIRVELMLPCPLLGVKMRALKLLDPEREKPERKRKAETETDKKSSAKRLAHPRYPNSYRLVEVADRPDGSAILRFILLDTFTYVPEKGPRKDQKEKAQTVIPPEYLQMILASFARPLVPLFGQMFPCDVRGVAQVTAQTLGSQLGLKEWGGQGDNVSSPDLRRSVTGELDRLRRVTTNRLLSISESLRFRPARVLCPRRFKSDDSAGDELVPASEFARQWSRWNTTRYKSQPLLLVDTKWAALYERTWVEPRRRGGLREKKRSGLYVAIPLPSARCVSSDSPLYPFVANPSDSWLKGFWWRNRINEFKPLLNAVTLTDRSRVLLVRFLPQGRERNGQNWLIDLEKSGREVCWYLITEKGGEFCFQVVTKKLVVPQRRPNQFSIFPAVIEEDDRYSVNLFWSMAKVDQNGWNTSGCEGFDSLSKSDQWPTGRERKRRANEAARWVIRSALEHNADVVVGEPCGIKKRGQGKMSAVNTRFNFADIIRLIKSRANDARPPVAVFVVSGFRLVECRGESPETQLAVVAETGERLRRR